MHAQIYNIVMTIYQPTSTYIYIDYKQKELANSVLQGGMAFESERL